MMTYTVTEDCKAFFFQPHPLVCKCGKKGRYFTNGEEVNESPLTVLHPVKNQVSIIEPDGLFETICNECLAK